ncbi:MAG: hypothetical protein WA691_09435 [Thermoplasmata archaeon]
MTITLSLMTMGGLGLFAHAECMDRGSVGTALFWTPFDLANAPYLGSTTYSASFEVYEPFGLTRVTDNDNLSNGNLSAGYFQTENWTVFAQANITESGIGLDNPCAAPFGAAPSPTNFTSSFGGFVLQGPGNTSNVNETTSFPLAPADHPPATFANGFVSANLPPVSTCGTSGRMLNFSSSSFDVSLTIPAPTGLLKTTVSVTSNQKFEYSFPANGGTWLVDDLQENSGLRGPGLAFSWEPC